MRRDRHASVQVVAGPRTAGAAARLVPRGVGYSSSRRQTVPRRRRRAARRRSRRRLRCRRRPRNPATSARLRTGGRSRRPGSRPRRSSAPARHATPTEGPVVLAGEGAVDHQNMVVNVQIQRRARPLHDGDAPGRPAAGAARVVCLQRRDGLPQDPSGQAVLPRELPPSSKRDGQHPLADGAKRKQAFGGLTMFSWSMTEQTSTTPWVQRLSSASW